MNRPKYVASCSGGKDSVATLLLAAQHNEPLDEAVFSEVMFDHALSGEVPEHRDFIYDRLKPYCENQLGIKCGDSTDDGLFSLDSCRCVGACGLAPVMMINEDVHGRLKPEMVKGILDSYRRNEEV